jgi:predicted anti-sigma-YlaC factor YlaD
VNCEKVRKLLPGYLDGAVLTGTWSDRHVTIGRHLESCEDCRDELRAYQVMSSMMSSVQRPMPPRDLALQIRVAAAQRLSDRNWLHYVRRARTRAELVLKNILEPLAPFPITGLEESGHAGPHALLVEATVNSQGEAVSYRILAGPDTDTVRRQLDLVLLFSRFRPEMSFGRFTSGGRVVLSFSDISIRG